MADESDLLVSELFYSIQGESTHAGAPCVFIRLAGCNLRCTYCDASYTYEETSQRHTISDIISFTARHPTALVEITGGEPLLQENVYPLMATLLKTGRTVLLETNGSLPLDRVPTDVIKIMDIKCPDSGMHDRMDLKSLTHLTARDNLKFVLSSRADFEWAVEFLHSRMPNLNQQRDRPAVLFSPVPKNLPASDLAAWILAEELPVRLQIQLHKILWPEQTRGV